MEPKNKGGRPPKDPETKRKVKRQVCMTEDEYKLISNSTGKLEMSVSGFFRAAGQLVLNKLESGEMTVDEIEAIIET
jgi:hypothetical protein